MELPFKYSYLIMSLGFFAVWLILYLSNKSFRKQMIPMSIVFGIAGVLVQFTYLHDWWRPLTITNTAIGIEDFIAGASFGGIAAVIYEYVLKKRIQYTRMEKKDRINQRYSFIAFGLYFIAVYGVCFLVLSLNSLIATSAAFVSGTAIIYFVRKDLIIQSLVTGLIFVVLAIVVYSITQLITPGWVNQFWYFKNVPNIIFLNVPVDDYIWYFLAGIFLGPLYEFWHDAKLVDAN